jgi:predicted house-cleaning noncanonical NTP pyrophosphatase (MazG superfamily)
MKTYNKLVRDKIPEVIKKSGSNCDYTVADKEERLALLMKKLDEEVLEFKEDKNLEELADIMEVLFGLANNLGFTEEELLKKREEKKGERGGINEGIVLQRVWSKDKL